MTLTGSAPWTMGSSVIFASQSMNSVYYGVFKPLSRLANLLKKIHELLPGFHAGKVN